jgi:CheY-like chemotaxis protein
MSSTDRKTILLVEDEPLIALAASQTIAGFGYEVLVSGTGEKAVRLAETDPRIDLILMDIDLGEGIDGPEAATRILRSRDLPVVFLTSHAERGMVERVKGITRYGYVIKNSGDFVLRSSIEMAFELFEAHESAQRSGEKFRLLFQNMSMGFALHEIILDAEGRPTVSSRSTPPSSPSRASQPRTSWGEPSSRSCRGRSVRGSSSTERWPSAGVLSGSRITMAS